VTTVADGVRAIGDCHPVIDSNVLISGGGEGTTSATTGVRCAANAGGTASRCVVVGNTVRGSSVGFPPSATGVRCDGGSCARIVGNAIDGRGGMTSYGIYLGATGAVVQDNDVAGGCSTQKAVGIFADDSYARLENNRVRGGGCFSSATVAALSYGLEARGDAGGHELDAHSNIFDGAGQPGNGTCASVGLLLESGTTTPTGGVGIYRDNIFRAGVCANNRADVAEADTTADPRIFEHDDLDVQGGAVLYSDNPANPLTTAAAVDALTDMTVSGTISADPQFVGYPADPHIAPGSACDGAGTPTGAPVVDMDGDVRSTSAPDIGVDEI
jgi:hypothetical protein